MEMIIRQSRESDFRATENLTREVFWDLYKPGSDEHFVLHKIRKAQCYIGELDLIMLEGEKIIGHIICTKARIADPMNNEHLVLCAGPFSIMNEYQRKGFGSILMEHCIERATALGYAAMILFGNPAYYHRFGFRNAIEYGICTREGLNFEPFMAKELRKDGLNGIQGRFIEDESFSTDATELLGFEKQFPYKEKHITATQLNL